MNRGIDTHLCYECKDNVEVATGNKGCCNLLADTHVQNSKSECCGAKQDKIKSLNIDFIYLDLSVCNRCQQTESNLEEAIAEVTPVLAATGVQVKLQKINVQNEKQALELGFISSPTIRINGRDIQLDVKESLCESCGEICGEDVDCRIWISQGKEHTAPPKGMIMEAILREVYGGAQEVNPEPLPAGHLSHNLKRFFQAKTKKKNSFCGDHTMS